MGTLGRSAGPVRNPSRPAKRLARRISHDYGRADHLNRYREVLHTAVSRDYRIGSMLDLAAMKGATPTDKWLILRHDVDVAPSIARRMLAIESDIGVTATYYFRLCTAHGADFDHITRSGADIGYHSEELATVAKAFGVTSPHEVREITPVAKELVVVNLARFAAATGRTIHHASSHGDFANSRLGVTNATLYDDELRHRTGIRFEAYDDDVNRPVTDRIADQPDAVDASQRAINALEAGGHVVYFLSHPRWWGSSRSEALIEDVNRLVDAARFARGARGRRIGPSFSVS